MFKYCQKCKENVPWEEVCKICNKKISGDSPPQVFLDEIAFYERLNFSFFCYTCGKMTYFQGRKIMLGISSKLVCSLCGSDLDKFSDLVEIPQLGKGVFFKPYEMNCRRRMVEARIHLETMLSENSEDDRLLKKIQKQNAVWKAYQTQRLLVYKLTELDGDLYREKLELDFWRKKLSELDKEHEAVMLSYCNSVGGDRDALQRYENIFYNIHSETQFKYNQSADFINRMEDNTKKFRECMSDCASSLNEGKWLQAVSLNDWYFRDLSLKARLLYALARDSEAYTAIERKGEKEDHIALAPEYPCDKCSIGKLVFIESERAYQCDNCGHRNNIP